MTQEDISKKQTQRTDLWLPRGYGVGGRIGSLELADAN